MPTAAAAMPGVEVARVKSPPRAIIELNVRYFRDLLSTETDPARRQTIATLLAEHEALLATLVQQSDKAPEH